MVLLHGATGGWDELLIAVAAFAVLWLAVKLAGRKPASDEASPAEEAPLASDERQPGQAAEAASQPPARRR